VDLQIHQKLISQLFFGQNGRRAFTSRSGVGAYHTVRNHGGWNLTSLQSRSEKSVLPLIDHTDQPRMSLPHDAGDFRPSSDKCIYRTELKFVGTIPAIFARNHPTIGLLQAKSVVITTGKNAKLGKSQLKRGGSFVGLALGFAS